ERQSLGELRGASGRVRGGQADPFAGRSARNGDVELAFAERVRRDLAGSEVRAALDEILGKADARVVGVDVERERRRGRGMENTLDACAAFGSFSQTDRRRRDNRKILAVVRDAGGGVAVALVVAVRPEPRDVDAETDV